MRGRGLQLILVVSLVLAGALAVVTASSGIARKRRSAIRRPNIIFVLTDDLAWNLVTARYMPHLVALERRGVAFTNYIVTDSLCCPSRSSIFTGLVPHNTGVFTNRGKQGGYHVFLRRGLEDQTYAVAIQPRGYLTSFMGKYLNGYGAPQMTSHVPPGWGDWHGAGYGYWEFNYELNEDGVIDRFGGPPPPASNAANYLTDVLNARAREFVALAASVHRPFVIEVATFAPHKPYIPAPRNANDFPGLSAPRGPSFDTNNTDPPAWLGHRAPLTRQHLELIDKGFRMRAQSVEAVDKLIADLEATLRAHGLAKDTYIVFSSDNGYHMGEHRLLSGKQTAFDSDIRVPLIVVGPGVARGRKVGALVQNIDLYPTFTELAGARPTGPVDGRSLVPLLNARRGERLWWRSLALIEHRGGTRPPDPDFEYGTLGGNPTSYEAIRLARAVYVEYVDGEREYYEIGADPFERHNVYARLPAAAKAYLHALVGQLSTCRGAGATSCWNAAQPQLVSP